MPSPLPNESSSARFQEDEIAYVHEIRRRRPSAVSESSFHEPGYVFRLGRLPVSLTWTEFRLVRFLSACPYRPFTRRQIAEAVFSSDCPVDEGQIDEHVRTLRDKLGIFSDYVQTVPHIGYRFKP